MNSIALISYLSKFENGLDHFSFNELNIAEANALKQHYENFKSSFENKFLGEAAPKENQQISRSSNPQALTEEQSILLSNETVLNATLNDIQGFMNLLTDSISNKQDLEIVAALKNANAKLSNLFGEMMELARIGFDQEESKCVSFNLKNVIKEVIYLSKTLQVDEHINFVTEIDRDIPNFIIGDPSRLSEILLKLIQMVLLSAKQGLTTLKIDLASKTNTQLYLNFTLFFSGKQHNSEDAYQQLHQPNSTNQLRTQIVSKLIKKQGGRLEINLEDCIKLNMPYGCKPTQKAENRSQIIQEMAGQTKPNISDQIKHNVSNRIDLDMALEDCMGQIDLLEELVLLFKQNIFEFIGKMKLYMQSLNLSGINFSAIKVEASLKMVGANSLLVLCNQIAFTSKTSNDNHTLKQLYEAFLEEYKEVEKVLENQLDEIRGANL